MSNRSSPTIVVAGRAEHWHVFQDASHKDSPGGLLEAFRTFVGALDPEKDGVLKIGSTSLCSHMADIVRLLRIPAVFVERPPPSDFVVPDFCGALADCSRRDHVRLLARTCAALHDAQGNLRSAHLDLLDQVDGHPAWVPWIPGERLCLSGFRIELLDTPRAGIHIRVGVPIEGSPLDACGYRIEPPRFLSGEKPPLCGAFVVIPSDPIEPLRPLDTSGSLGDAYEDGMLSCALHAFYGCDPDEANAFRRGVGLAGTGIARARRAA